VRVRVQSPLPVVWKHGVMRRACLCVVPAGRARWRVAVQDPTPAGADNKAIILLACLHPLHNACWERWVAAAAQQQGGDAPATCPTCKQVVPLFHVSGAQ
jgi:hypothetical protein